MFPGRGRRRTLSSSRRSRTLSASSRINRGSTAGSENPETSLRRSSRISSFSISREEEPLPLLGTPQAETFTIPEERETLSHRAAEAERSRRLYRQRRQQQTMTARRSDNEGNMKYIEPNVSNAVDPAIGATRAEAPMNESPVGPMERNSDYRMHVMVQPPREARPGSVLWPPLTIRLRVNGTGEVSSTEHDDFLRMSAVAWLAPLNENGTSLSPRATLLRGNSSDSVHLICEQQPDVAEGLEEAAPQDDPEDSGDGFVWFRGLTIVEPGTYKIRVSLKKMEIHGGSAATSLQGGAVTLQTVDTRPIHVHESSHGSEISKLASTPVIMRRSC
ncbi:MAG: hypothetical protein M1827_006760 [Pycnora praestabilis]|nr:MAG: hypothetical protein M1827_006760 [Pycnora praestabilis]